MRPRYIFPRFWIDWTPKPFRRYNFRGWPLPEGLGVSWLGMDKTWSRALKAAPLDPPGGPHEN